MIVRSIQYNFIKTQTTAEIMKYFKARKIFLIV